MKARTFNVWQRPESQLNLCRLSQTKPCENPVKIRGIMIIVVGDTPSSVEINAILIT